jgi:uncharacterized protein (TIGR02452 family)
LSLVLRHNPTSIGIVLDEAGWTSVNSLLAALAQHGHPLTREELAELVASSDKQRFALSEDGTRIRANQGHSIEVDLELPPATPPALLYHGTNAEFLGSIREQGLLKGSRQHVHLSADLQTATQVGARRGKPVILSIRAEEMAATGHTFYCSANGVWLTAYVPPAFVDFPEPRVETTKVRNARAEIARETLAACEAGAYTNANGTRVEIADAIERAKRGTRLYDAATYRGAVRHCPAKTAISVTGETTLAAIRRLADPRAHLACLNFASARNPGGGFMGGAQAQEESLARSSALYPCQLEMPDHYARNRAHDSVLYLDLAIWSPHVPFFRDDDGGWLDAPIACSVITCAAPNAGALRQHGRFDADAIEAALRRRGELVLSIARDHSVDRLILGAWGAGVFGNDPAAVARVFEELLAEKFAATFGEVVFALAGGPGGANYDAFAATFG